MTQIGCMVLYNIMHQKLKTYTFNLKQILTIVWNNIDFMILQILIAQFTFSSIIPITFHQISMTQNDTMDCHDSSAMFISFLFSTMFPKQLEIPIFSISWEFHFKFPLHFS